MKRKYLVVDSNFFISLVLKHHDALFEKIIKLEKEGFFDKYDGILIMASVEKEVYKTLVRKFRLVLNEILLKFPDKNFDRNSFDIWLKNKVLNSLPYYENTFEFLIEFLFSFKKLKRIEKKDLLELDPYNIVDYLVDEVFMNNEKLINWKIFGSDLILNKEKLKKKNLINLVDCAKKIFKKGDKDFYIFEEFVYWLYLKEDHLDFLTFDKDFSKNIIFFRRKCNFRKFEVFYF